MYVAKPGKPSKRLDTYVPKSRKLIFMYPFLLSQYPVRYSIPQEICTRFLLCCALLWLYIDCFPISIRLTLLALWQSNDCPSASKATLMNMDKYFMWIHYERLHTHNKTVCIFLGIYCSYIWRQDSWDACLHRIYYAWFNFFIIGISAFGYAYITKCACDYWSIPFVSDWCLPPSNILCMI